MSSLHYSISRQLPFTYLPTQSLPTRSLEQAEMPKNFLLERNHTKKENKRKKERKHPPNDTTHIHTQHTTASREFTLSPYPDTHTHTHTHTHTRQAFSILPAIRKVYASLPSLSWNPKTNSTTEIRVSCPACESAKLEAYMDLTEPLPAARKDSIAENPLLIEFSLPICP